MIAYRQRRDDRARAILVFGLALAGWLLALWQFFSSLDFTKGRILRINGRSVLPRVKARGRSTAAVRAVYKASLWQRVVLTRLWLVSARMEFASVFAFRRLALWLDAVEAPPTLVERCWAAAEDERLHTGLCLSLAERLSGVAWSLSEPEDWASQRDLSLERLAAGSLLDGAFAEGVAAETAALASRLAQDGEVRTTLARIAQDEARHSELGWDIVRWCVDHGGPPVVQAVRRAADSLAARRTAAMPPIPGVSSEWLEANGLPTQVTLGEIAKRHASLCASRASSMTSRRFHNLDWRAIPEDKMERKSPHGSRWSS